MEAVKSVAPMIGTVVGVVALGHSYSAVSSLNTKASELENKHKEQADGLVKLSTNIDSMRSTFVNMQQDIAKLKKSVKSSTKSDDIDELRESFEQYVSQSEAQITMLKSFIIDLVEKLNATEMKIGIDTRHLQVQSQQAQQPMNQGLHMGYQQYNSRMMSKSQHTQAKPPKKQQKKQQDSDDDSDSD